MERDLAAARTLDPLTGFARREHFVEVLRSEVRRARRYGLDLGVAVFDVDDFAAINARWVRRSAIECCVTWRS